MRGGISYITKRHSEADNKYMKLYDDSKQSKYANNLYSWVLSQYLPENGFKWLNQVEVDWFYVNSVSEHSLYGYILEVDLEYLDKLHRVHND